MKKIVFILALFSLIFISLASLLNLVLVLLGLFIDLNLGLVKLMKFSLALYSAWLSYRLSQGPTGD